MTTPPVTRTEPPTLVGEREMVEGWLDYHRLTLAEKCAGLDDEHLRRRSVPPSELSLLGLVRHMAEVERGWYRKVFAGEDVRTLYCESDRDGDFHVGEADTYAEAYAAWQAEIAWAREATAGRSLDDRGVVPDKETGQPFTLRWIHTHMIEEYARHNGHADLIREVIDGTKGL